MSDKRESILGQGDGAEQLLTRPRIHTHTHTQPLLRDFWRANNEGIKGEEAENWRYTHFFRNGKSALLCVLLRHIYLIPRAGAVCDVCVCVVLT